MANIIYNYLKVEGVDNCEKFRQLAMTNGEFSFENIIPMPKELEDTQEGTISYNVEKLLNDPKNVRAFIKKYNGDNPDYYVIMGSKEESGIEITDMIKYIADKAKEAYSRVGLEDYAKAELAKHLNEEQLTNLFDQYLKYYIGCLYAYHKTGYLTWYDWRLLEWGCKWDADVTYIESDKTEEGKECAIYIEFQTPWCTPREALTALTKKGVEFTNMYGDEGSSEYCGLYSYEVDWYGEIDVKNVQPLLWYSLVYFGCLDIEELKILLEDEELENDTLEDIGINNEETCKSLQEIFDAYWF